MAIFQVVRTCTVEFTAEVEADSLVAASEAGDVAFEDNFNQLGDEWVELDSEVTSAIRL